MVKRPKLFCALALILLVIPFAPGQADKKIQVKDQADLPGFTYPLSGPASLLLQADAATFNAFAAKVRTDLEAVLGDYEIEDKATLRSPLSAKLDLQHLAGEDAAALETVKALRALEEKPSPRLTTALLMQCALESEIATNSASGPAFEQDFTRRYREAVDSLPWDLVGDWAKSARGDAQLSSKALIVGSVKTNIDPAVEKSGVVDNQEACGSSCWSLFLKWRVARLSISRVVPVMIMLIPTNVPSTHAELEGQCLQMRMLRTRVTSPSKTRECVGLLS